MRGLLPFPAARWPPGAYRLRDLMLLFAFIILGALSGYTIRRIGSGRALRPWERKVLRPLGWLLVGLWFAMSAMLILVVASRLG